MNNTFSLVGLFFILILGCGEVKKLSLPYPLDTRDREISYQEKKTYHIKELGVYASNEFDGARLNNLRYLEKDTVIATILPENTPVNKSPWYSFKLWSENITSLKIKFEFPKGFKNRYIPKISYDKKTWMAIDSIDFVKTDTLSVLNLVTTKDTIWISAQELINTSAIYNWTNKISNFKYAKIDTVGFSTLGRWMPAIDIYKNSKKDKKTIVVMSRQHPPEVPGHIAFEKFIETITANSLTENFFENHRVLVIPVLNPDGVDLGHWRHNAKGIDTNRDWAKYRQKETENAVNYLVKEIEEHENDVVIGIDFHSTQEDVFYTTSDQFGLKKNELAKKWLSNLDKRISEKELNIDDEAEGRPVSKNWFIYYYKAPAVTYEIGDEVSREWIDRKAKLSAEELMKVCLDKN